MCASPPPSSTFPFINFVHHLLSFPKDKTREKKPSPVSTGKGTSIPSLYVDDQIIESKRTIEREGREEIAHQGGGGISNYCRKKSVALTCVSTTQRGHQGKNGL